MSHETNMDDGQTAEVNPAAKPDPLANLNPRQRDLVEGVLQNYPTLTTEEAIEMLQEFGGL